MNRDGWPQENADPTVDPNKCKIQHGERAVSRHSEEWADRVAVRPTSHDQPNQGDACEPTYPYTRTGDFGAKQ
jgi:hypothetical protein